MNTAMMHTVHIVGMLSQDVLVEFLSLVELAHGFIESGQVIGGCDGDGVVVVLIMLALSFCPLQRSQEVFLQRKLDGFCGNEQQNCNIHLIRAKKNKNIFTLASPRFPNLKCKAPKLLRISGGTSAWTFSWRIRVAVPYAERAPCRKDGQFTVWESCMLHESKHKQE